MSQTVNSSSPLVSVVMGSYSDWVTMLEACKILGNFDIPYEKQIVSAHRSPDVMYEYAKNAIHRNIKIIIAGAGGSAHLPGMIASLTTLPVLGVPIQSKTLNGVDSLYSIVQMPGGIPVGTLAIGVAGAINAGLLAVRILSIYDTELREKIENYQKELKESALSKNKDLKL
ncbi:MAG: 5-(carboxyamino)imidazole ribonucleotide mutase [Leptospiraceae bacterium]|nr:5-(carboxyamino)imidazole ribonucleotide mutase [Leptospiraceae bacterium]